jgi:ORF6N domain-containing protein
MAGCGRIICTTEHAHDRHKREIVRRQHSPVALAANVRFETTGSDYPPAADGESERSICLISSICAEDGSTRTEYSCMMVGTRSVLLDSDLAALYQVATKTLTRAVRRNPGRFPAVFMFQLAVEESASLRSQSGALKTGRGKHRKYAPYVFTEQGIAMLSSVLTSERAVQVNRDHEGVYSHRPLHSPAIAGQRRRTRP